MCDFFCKNSIPRVAHFFANHCYIQEYRGLLIYRCKERRDKKWLLIKILSYFDLTGDKETIISTLANQAFEHGRLEDKQEYIEAVLKREKEYSAALGYEVAIPHGQSDTVKDPFVVFGRVKEPIL